MSQIKEKVALKLFGNKDYESILSVLLPSDPLVKKFHKEVEKMGRVWR